MAFRTIEITGPAELHVKNNSLIVEKELSELKKCCGMPEDAAACDSGPQKSKSRAGSRAKKQTSKVCIPLEDIYTLVCMGAEIRISTMAMAKLCEHKITMMMLNEKYCPAGILAPYESNARQALIARKQVYMEENRKDTLWRTIIRKKIQNQSKALHILDLDGEENVLAFEKFLADHSDADIDPIEAAAAKEYFQHILPDINRRDDAPENSCLNYGYSIIRNSLIRAIIASGLLPSFGLHHKSLFNAYNLADDLIEPFRPCVDLIAYQIKGTELKLNRSERKQMAEVLHHAVLLDGHKTSVLQAIDAAVNDLKRFITEETDHIRLPDVLPSERVCHIKE